MKLRMLSSVVKLAAATAIMVGVAASASAQNAAPAPAGASNGAYKIGVVDRKKVFDEYGKKKTQWSNLDAKKTQIENQLNAKFETLKSKRDTFDGQRASMSEDERNKQETALSKELLDLQTDARIQQDALTKEGEQIIKGIRDEIDAAVKAIGDAENYHLILEGDRAFSSVIYSSTALDITGKVLEYVEAHSKGGAPAAAAEPKAQPASGKKK